MSVAVAAVLLVGPQASHAAPDAVTVTVGNHFIAGDDDPYPLRIGPYQTGTVNVPLVVQAGNNVIHVNRDIEGHNLTSVLRDQNGDRYFAGETIGQSEATVVVTAHLAPGDYPFVCAVHSEFMQGTLTVA